MHERFEQAKDQAYTIESKEWLRRKKRRKKERRKKERRKKERRKDEWEIKREHTNHVALIEGVIFGHFFIHTKNKFSTPPLDRFPHWYHIVGNDTLA